MLNLCNRNGRRIKGIKKLSKKELAKNYVFNPLGIDVSSKEIMEDSFIGKCDDYNHVFRALQKKLGTEVRWIGFSKNTISSVYIST